MKKSAKPSILTINGGSSSIKFAQFEAGDALDRILEGEIDRTGAPEASLRVTGLDPMDTFSRPVTASDQTVAVGILMDWIEACGGPDALTRLVVCVSDGRTGPRGRNAGDTGPGDPCPS